MYKMGESVCCSCMNENIDKENEFAYIINSLNDLVVVPKKNCLGHYKPVCISKGRKETAEFVGKPKTKNGLFLNGKVRITLPNGESEIHTLDITNRICYYCYQKGTINYLDFSAGYYPTFVFSVP